MALDPLTQVYNHIWTLLEANAPWAAAVRTRNRIKLTAMQAEPVFQQVSDADCPRSVLVPAGGSVAMPASSSSHVINQQYDLTIVSSKQEVAGTGDAYLHRLKLLTLGALATGIHRTAFTPDPAGMAFSLTTLYVAACEERAGGGPWADQLGGWSMTVTIVAVLDFARSTLEGIT